jgi:hypothetical protein
VAIATIALTAAIALAVILGSYLSRSPLSERATIEAIDVKALVERIIKVESSGIPNTKNKLSSSSGVGQFLDDTWLEAIRNHRRHLIKGRSDKFWSYGRTQNLLKRLLRCSLGNMPGHCGNGVCPSRPALFI